MLSENHVLLNGSEEERDEVHKGKGISSHDLRVDLLPKSPRRKISTNVPRAIQTGPRNDRIPDMTVAFQNLLVSLGEDTKREGLCKTPERAAKAMLYFTKGYEERIEGRNC